MPLGFRVELGCSIFNSHLLLALVKGFDISYHNKQTISFDIDPDYGN